MKWMWLLFSSFFLLFCFSKKYYHWLQRFIDDQIFASIYIWCRVSTWLRHISFNKEFGRKHPHTCKLESAICFNPVDKLFNLAGVKERRDNNGLAKPDFVPSSKSLAFASRICDCFVIKRSAKLFTAAARSSGVSDCRARLPVRAEIETINVKVNCIPAYFLLNYTIMITI